MKGDKIMDETGIFGVIGCGRIAGHHCNTIVRTEGLKLAAVCDLVVDRALAYSKECKVPAYASYHEMLIEHPEIDAVVIATPSGMHFEHATELIDTYKKHIVVEKPTFLRPSEVRLAYKAAKSAGVQVFPVFQNRYNKAVRRVKAAIVSGELGAVRLASVRVRWCRPQRYYDLAPWRGTFALDGGALTNQGIHHVDLLRYLAGEVSNLSATMATLGAEIEVEDSATASFRFHSGAIGALEVTTAARPDDYEASISLVCEKGIAQIGGIAVNELQIFTPDPSQCAPFSEDFGGNVYGFGHSELYRSIAESLKVAKPYLISEDDCWSTINLLHSFYSAAHSQNNLSVQDGQEFMHLGEVNESLRALYRTPR